MVLTVLTAQGVNRVLIGCQQDVDKVVTWCQQNVNKVLTELTEC